MINMFDDVAAVIFDMDDTLLNTELGRINAFKEIILEGFPNAGEDFLNELMQDRIKWNNENLSIGIIPMKWIEHYVEKYNVKNKSVEEFINLYTKHIISDTVKYSYTDKVLS